jgi:outer membrane lipoprotein-sorting protein
VKKQFDVKKVDPAKDDPAGGGTVHLALTPRPGTDFARKFHSIDVWVSQSTGMPIRMRTVDPSEDKIQTTDLTNIKLNTNPKDADFELPPVEGWEVTSDPWHE